MTRCPACGGEAPDGSRYCPSCARPLEGLLSAPTETSAKSDAPGPPISSESPARGVSLDSLDRARFLPGTMLAGRYRIIGLLGRGGMGEVYRATDTQTGETVAVKALSPDVLARDPDLLERFVREGEALRQLNHPNIVHMVTACEEGRRHYLVMEYVGGGSLEDLLRKQGRLPPARAVEIGLDLADALTRAHRLGIIHRDLKPANVLLAPDGTPRLADFGIAHVECGSCLTQTGVLIGTVDYLSPEACQGKSLDERADIWAFGVLLFQLVSGSLPFEGKSLTAKITAILTQPVPDLAQLAPGLPDGLLDLVYRMLEKDRQQRIPSVRLVGAELEAIAKGREPTGPKRSPHAQGMAATEVLPVGSPRHNLPLHTAPFVGREAELVELAELLADQNVRLLCLIGAGGVGKTRLAIEAGKRQIGNCAQGVYFVALAGLANAEGLVPSIAQTIGFSFYAGSEPRQQLLEYLREKRMLLILDNFEHLLEGVSFLSDLLEADPLVKVIVTSRVRLEAPGEQLVHLEGMDFPDGENLADTLGYSAVELFLQCARRVRPEFRPAGNDLQNVARICRLVGGLPLGILLAAAWVEMLTPAEIAGEIARSLDFLHTTRRELPPRQQSMRAVFDYSWNSLSDRERNAFRAISIFRGGFTAEAAQHVAGAGLRELMGLVNKSLVHRNPSGRYEVHELLRQYGEARLTELAEEADAARDRHCTYFAQFMNGHTEQIVGAQRRQILRQIQAEIANVQSAWERALSTGRFTDLDAILLSVAEYYLTRGWYLHGRNLFSRAARSIEAAGVDRSSESRLLLGRLYLQQGRFSVMIGDEERADPALQASIEIFHYLGARREAAYALCYLGGAEDLYGSRNAEPCAEALRLFQEIGDLRGSALALRGLAWAALHQASYTEARNKFQEGLATFRKLRDQVGITTTLGGLGFVLFIIGEYREAVSIHEEMLDLCREAGDQGGIARALAFLGMDSFVLREYEKARDLFRQSLAIFREIGNNWGIADELGDLGVTHIALGDYAGGARLAQDSLKVYPERFILYGQSRYWGVMGQALAELGDFRNARKYFHMSLEAARKGDLPSRFMFTLVFIARLKSLEGDPEGSAELLGLVLNHRIGWQINKDQAAEVLQGVKTQLGSDHLTAALARGSDRDLEATVTELLAELAES